MLNPEKEIFKKCEFDFTELKDYGFTLKGDVYVFNKSILNGDFTAEIEVDGSWNVNGKIIEVAFDEEYLNHKIEGMTGGFVGVVREEYAKILTDIKKNCCTEKPFMSRQANEIAKRVLTLYGDKPQFAWEKFPDFGIFKNETNGKWYGLIMNIRLAKLDKNESEKEVEIINMKLSQEDVSRLLTKQGFYPAYHMNKKSWISVILDGTIADDEIMSYLVQSHKFTE